LDGLAPSKIAYFNGAIGYSFRHSIEKIEKENLELKKIVKQLEVSLVQTPLFP